ncbi:MAG: hypothetical protein LBK77_08190 [Spirochaetaceae bacterium]|nr:hypothetical protein [Spirochaetaceae bacterium]
MKFRVFIIFFNVFLFFFLAVVCVLPFAALGKDLAVSFWKTNWYAVPLVLVILAAVDIYFAVNGRIFFFLEKEDWPALVQLLEEKVFRRGRYTSRLVKLLANTYLVLSDAGSVTELEKKLRINKNRLIDGSALIFGAARILNKDHLGAAEFFSSRLPGRENYKAGAQGEWIRWYFGFSLLLARNFAAAADTFTVLAREGRDGILTGLSAYFLDDNLARFLPRRSAELRETAAEGKERVRQTLKRRIDWNRELKRLETEVYAAILSSYTGKAGDFVYA